MTAANAGAWQFRDADRDDWSGIWLDLDRDGVFESNGALNSGQGEQLAWNDQGAKTVTLTEGDYLIGLTHLEGGGGSRMEFRFKSPTMAGETTIKPSDPAQAGIFLTTLSPGNVVKRGTGTVTLTGQNTYVGQTLVEEGTLVAASPSGPGRHRRRDHREHRRYAGPARRDHFSQRSHHAQRYRRRRSAGRPGEHQW